ncbi:hypothetical protein BDV96DRAFT_659285, partial [Lophiotrema nucula]
CWYLSSRSLLLLVCARWRFGVARKGRSWRSRASTNFLANRVAHLQHLQTSKRYLIGTKHPANPFPVRSTSAKAMLKATAKAGRLDASVLGRSMSTSGTLQRCTRRRSTAFAHRSSRAFSNVDRQFPHSSIEVMRRRCSPQKAISSNLFLH